MSDPANGTAQAVPPPAQAAHPPFPFVRLIYAFGFGILAYFVLMVLFVMAVIQFIVLAANGRLNDELRHFCANLMQYLFELLAYITFVRDEQPFPIGRFPGNPAA
ncbi:MAG TPA: DUF4389 domain-containing protein [Rhizomicrobium sp.]